MKLPHREAAIILREKLDSYLLSLSHPVGKSKARYFRAKGYDETNVEQLARDLLGLAQDEEVVESKSSSFGTTYLLDGELHTPNGETARLRTVWIIHDGEEIPRFMTAYPQKAESGGTTNDQ